MGKLELPLPEIAERSLESAAKYLQARISAQVPEELRPSISVRPFREGTRTGLSIEYDDRAESLVFAAVEYPTGSSR